MSKICLCGTPVAPKCSKCATCKKLAKKARFHSYYYERGGKETACARMREYEKLPARKESLTKRYQLMKTNAKSKGRIVEITKEQYATIMNLPCFYCQDQLCADRTGSRMDRKDNALGYLMSNVVPCCKICNSIKQELFTVEETLVMVAALVALRKQKRQLSAACQ